MGFALLSRLVSVMPSNRCANHRSIGTRPAQLEKGAVALPSRPINAMCAKSRERKDAPWLVGDLPKLFDGRVDQLDRVTSKRFTSLQVNREKSAAIQVDGELIESQVDVTITVKPRSLTVLVPIKPDV